MPFWIFWKSHSHSYAEQVECQISATKSKAGELLGKAIELGGEGYEKCEKDGWEKGKA